MQFSSYSLLELVDDRFSVKANNKSDKIFLCSFFHIQLKQLKRTRTKAMFIQWDYAGLLAIKAEHFLVLYQLQDVEEYELSLSATEQWKS